MVSSGVRLYRKEYSAAIKNARTLYDDFMKTPFVAGTGMLGATEPGQIVTADNVTYLPAGSVVKLYDFGYWLIHLHDDLWLRLGPSSWCYDTVENFKSWLPGELSHIPNK